MERRISERDLRFRQRARKVTETGIWTTFHFKTTQKTTQKTILDYLAANPTATRDEIAAYSGITSDGRKYHLNKLQKQGLLARQGGRKEGVWIVIQNNTSE